MKTLLNAEDCANIRARIGSLRPDNARRWGRMTCPQMICHLNDCFRLTLGEKTAEPIDKWFTRTIVKWVALYSPTPWPHGYKSRPEFDQEAKGTPPQVFENDLRDLKTLLDRFLTEGDRYAWRHPGFGVLSRAEACRWAYLHLDHHLRQFGV